MVVRKIPHSLEKSVERILDADRLHHDCRDLFRVIREDALQRADVVVCPLMRQRPRRRRDTRVPRAVADAPIVPAVISALGDSVTPGERARQAHGGGRRLRTGLQKANPFRGGNHRHQQFGNLHLEWAAQREPGPRSTWACTAALTPGSLYPRMIGPRASG